MMMHGIEEFDSEKYEAQRMVGEAFMKTEKAKAQVEELAADLRHKKAETQRKLEQMSGTHREIYPGASGR